MRPLILLFVGILFFACTNDAKKESTKVTAGDLKNNQLEKVVKTNTFLSLTADDIEFIENRSLPISDEFEIGFVSAEDTIDTDVLTKFLPAKVYNQNGIDSLLLQYAWAYKFYQFKEYKKFYLFIFSYEDESCCIYNYGCIINKDKLEVSQIALLGYVGGDGGWEGETKGKWIDDHLLSTTTSSYYDQDFNDSTNNAEIDSNWLHIHLLKSGSIKYQTVKSVSYIGDSLVKKIEN